MAELKRQRELFEAALAVAPTLRQQFVQAQCGVDAALCASVLALLAADAADEVQSAHGGLNALAVDPMLAPIQQLAQSFAQDALAGAVAAENWVGKQLGPYLVSAEIGRGGMGVVLRAERADGAFTQTVAIKVILGIADAAARARFGRERELLARLNHPNIAKLLDGGELSDGTPYLVMEFVAGTPLSLWIKQQQPSLIQRLEMFRALCDAVQHAHQHLIVHRDLKPANILIDVENRPKLLDFGIARLLDQSIGEHVTTQRMMTLAYASPEQLRGGMASTASDIHALGLLLFELLVGAPMRPNSTPADAFTVHASKLLLPISKKPSAQARQMLDLHIRADAARLKGDLDYIVLKCTREEPSERYSSAAALAQDISRYLQHRPLESRRGEWRYAAWKFIRRNPFAVATLACSAIALSFFAVQLKIERDRAQSAAIAANEQAALADQTTQYLVQLFKSADPANARGQTLSARAVLDRGYAQLQKSRVDAPAVRAKLLATFGEIYLEIGMPEPALAGLEQALALIPDTDESALARAQILENLSNAQVGANQLPAALKSAQQALRIYQAQRGPRSVEVARALIRIGICEQSGEDFAAAHTRFEQARQIAQALPAEQAVLAEALQYLGIWAVRTKQAKLGEDYLRQALAIKRTLFGIKHPSTLDSLQALVFVLGELGDIPAWEASASELAEARKAVHGADSSPYFQALFARSTLQTYGLKLREAEATSREMVAGFARLSAKPLLEDFLAYASLANVLMARGDMRQAVQWQQRALDGFASAQACASANGIKQRYRMARMQMLLGNYAVAQSQATMLLDALAAAGKAESVEALETQLLARNLSAFKPNDLQASVALLDKIAALRGQNSPLLVQQALELAQSCKDAKQAIELLQAWQPRAKALRLYEAKFALALAERRIEIAPKSRAARQAARQLVTPFAAELGAELFAQSDVKRRLDLVFE